MCINIFSFGLLGEGLSGNDMFRNAMESSLGSIGRRTAHGSEGDLTLSRNLTPPGTACGKRVWSCGTRTYSIPKNLYRQCIFAPGSQTNSISRKTFHLHDGRMRSLFRGGCTCGATHRWSTSTLSLLYRSLRPSPSSAKARAPQTQPAGGAIPASGQQVPTFSTRMKGPPPPRTA